MIDIKKIEEKARYIRREAFEIVINAGRGHMGGSFSCVEILKNVKNIIIWEEHLVH